MNVSSWTRRRLFQSGAASLALKWLTGASLPLPAASAAEPENVYTRIGVRPFINCTAAYTIYSGLQTLPSVKRAIDDASRHSVSIDELMAKAGARLAELLGAENAIVTAGSASSFTLATVACIVGADPEKIQNLPHLDGLKNEVIMPRDSRNEYDHAIRATGARIITVASADEFHRALSDRTAMVAVWGEQPGSIPLEEIAQAAHRRSIPVAVDGAAEIPTMPNRYLSRGADLVAYSGGKYLRGPQCTGVLIGRRDLVSAAWVNSAPHHGFGRTMKVGKEEIIGVLTAVESLKQRDHREELALWNSWFTHISDRVKAYPGVETRFLAPVSTNPHPKLIVQWDPNRVGLTSDRVRQLLMDGEPRVMILSSVDPYSIPIRAAGMNAGDEKLVADRLCEILEKAPRALPRRSQPTVNLDGKWAVEIRYAAGSSRHALIFRVDRNRITGTHSGAQLSGPLIGYVDGDRVQVQSKLNYAPNIDIEYVFTGRITPDSISGDIDLGEYGRATWTAQRA